MLPRMKTPGGLSEGEAAGEEGPGFPPGSVEVDFAAVKADGEASVAEGGDAADLVIDGGGDGDVLERVVVGPIGSVG